MTQLEGVRLKNFKRRLNMDHPTQQFHTKRFECCAVQENMSVQDLGRKKEKKSTKKLYHIQNWAGRNKKVSKDIPSRLKYFFRT